MHGAPRVPKCRPPQPIELTARARASGAGRPDDESRSRGLPASRHLLQSLPARLNQPSIRPGAPGERPRLKSTIVRSLEEGTALFNRRQFFEAHEVWEDGWRIADGRDRLLLHGLIQVAAGFHKLQCGQPGGCATLLSKGAGKLASVRSVGKDRLAAAGPP